MYAYAFDISTFIYNPSEETLSSETLYELSRHSLSRRPVESLQQAVDSNALELSPYTEGDFIFQIINHFADITDPPNAKVS